MPVETRWMRSDRLNVNGLLCYRLLTANTAACHTTPDLFLYDRVGIRVWKRSAAGVETEITFGGVSGTPVAQVAIPFGLTVVRSATCTPDATPMVATDTIVVRVYARNAATLVWTMLVSSGGFNCEYQTEQLGTTILNSALWTVYYQFTYSALADEEYFRWGHSTSCPSRITNFTWGIPIVVAGKGRLRNILMDKEFGW